MNNFDGYIQSKPMVDVLLATYNGEKYLADQLKSLYGQSYDKWRLLISDDGSTDSTISILSEAARQGVWIIDVTPNEKKHSATKNFLYLLTRTDAEYVMFCDQDDVWNKDKIELSLSRILAMEVKYGKDTPLAVFGDSCVVDENLSIINPSFMSTLESDARTITLPKLLISNVVQGCTMMMNRALVNLAVSSSYSDSFEYHDYWLAALVLATGHIEYIDEPLLLYRQHGDNVAGASERKSMMLKVRRGLMGLHERGRAQFVIRNSASFTDKAKALLNCGITFSGEVTSILDEMSSFKSLPMIRRLQLIKSQGLLDNKDVYSASSQLVAWMLVK